MLLWRLAAIVMTDLQGTDVTPGITLEKHYIKDFDNESWIQSLTMDLEMFFWIFIVQKWGNYAVSHTQGLKFCRTIPYCAYSIVSTVYSFRIHFLMIPLLHKHLCTNSKSHFSVLVSNSPTVTHTQTHSHTHTNTVSKRQHSYTHLPSWQHLQMCVLIPFQNLFETQCWLWVFHSSYEIGARDMSTIQRAELDSFTYTHKHTHIRRQSHQIILQPHPWLLLLRRLACNQFTVLCIVKFMLAHAHLK